MLISFSPFDNLSKIIISVKELNKFHSKAALKLTNAGLTYTWYFKDIQLALEEALKFVALIMPGEVTIILQLLCLVP